MQQEQLVSERVHVDDPGHVIEFYYEKGWTDGLPVVPATEERVRQFLSASGRSPSDVVGVVPTRGRVITAEKSSHQRGDGRLPARIHACLGGGS